MNSKEIIKELELEIQKLNSYILDTEWNNTNYKSLMYLVKEIQHNKECIKTIKHIEFNSKIKD